MRLILRLLPLENIFLGPSAIICLSEPLFKMEYTYETYVLHS